MASQALTITSNSCLLTIMKDGDGGELLTHLENRKSFYSKAGSVCLSVDTIGGVGEFVAHTMPEAIILDGVAVLSGFSRLILFKSPINRY